MHTIKSKQKYTSRRDSKQRQSCTPHLAQKVQVLVVTNQGSFQGSPYSTINHRLVLTRAPATHSRHGCSCSLAMRRTNINSNTDDTMRANRNGCSQCNLLAPSAPQGPHLHNRLQINQVRDIDVRSIRKKVICRI